MVHAGGAGWRRAAGRVCVVGGSIALVVGLQQVPSSATFAGGCTDPAASSGSCTIDEPAGDNPATHGTVTYRVVASSLRFDFAPVEDITTVVVCVVVNANQPHPFIPTTPTTCTDTSSSKRYDGTYQDPYIYDLTTLAGWSTGQSVYFAIALEQAAMTTYAVGGVSPIATPRTATTDPVTPTTAPPVTAEAGTVTAISSSDGARDLSGVAPVGALLVVVGCRLLRLTAGAPPP